MLKESPLILILSLLASFAITSCEQQGADNKTDIDIIIEADHIVTMDSSNSILNESAIAITNGIIVDIDSIENINKKYRATKKINGKNRIAMPGLINGHSHAAMTLLRGVADDRSLID